jgi:hypothetical protein
MKFYGSRKIYFLTIEITINICYAIENKIEIERVGQYGPGKLCTNI